MHSFPDHDTHTAQWAGFKGKSNGDLLRAADAASYDVLLKVDRGIPHQQSAGLRLSIILIRSSTNQIEDLLPLVDAISPVLGKIHQGQTIIVP